MVGLAQAYTRKDKLVMTPIIKPISIPRYSPAAKVIIKIRRSFSETQN